MVTPSFKENHISLIKAMKIIVELRLSMLSLVSSKIFFEYKKK